MNYREEFIHRYFPAFAAFASLREIFRVSVAAQPRCVLRGEKLFPSWLRRCHARASVVNYHPKNP